jgi:hypothetical protein
MSSLVLYNPRVNKYNCTRLLSDTNVQTVNCVFQRKHVNGVLYISNLLLYFRRVIEYNCKWLLTHPPVNPVNLHGRFEFYCVHPLLQYTAWTFFSMLLNRVLIPLIVGCSMSCLPSACFQQCTGMLNHASTFL